MDMLSYSKEREPAIEDTNVNRVVDNVLELLSGRIKEMGAKLENPIERRSPAGACRSRRFASRPAQHRQQCPRCRRRRRSPYIAVGTALEDDGEWVRIVVLDNGVGIPPNKQPDIFKPFVSSKGSKGTGLGLAVSRKILREHGGDILLQSQLGKGSKFILRLPLKSPLSPEAGGTGNELPTLRPPDEE